MDLFKDSVYIDPARGVSQPQATASPNLAGKKRASNHGSTHKNHLTRGTRVGDMWGWPGQCRAKWDIQKKGGRNHHFQGSFMFTWFMFIALV